MTAAAAAFDLTAETCFSNAQIKNPIEILSSQTKGQVPSGTA
jgi:hypothetical protein